MNDKSINTIATKSKIQIFNYYKKYVLLFFLGTFLVIVPVLILSLSRPTNTVTADWWDDTWAYRIQIPISKTTAAQTDVYIAFDGLDVLDTSDTDKFQSDCGDVRFTKENGELLPYYINSGCGTSSTDIDVYFDSIILGDQNIYMYYSNPAVQNGFEESGFSTEATNYTIGSSGSEEVTPGPSAYWGMNEGYGTTIYETIAGNDGTISGASWTNLCLSEQCLVFDGTDDVVTVTASDEIDLNGKSGYSLCAWIRPISDGENNTGEIVSKGNSYLRVDTESSGAVEVTANFDLSTSDANLNTTQTINTSEWSHVCATYADDADDELIIYLNGIDVGSSSGGSGSTADDSASDLQIGGDSSNNFDGLLMS